MKLDNDTVRKLIRKWREANRIKRALIISSGLFTFLATPSNLLEQIPGVGHSLAGIWTSSPHLQFIALIFGLVLLGYAVWKIWFLASPVSLPPPIRSDVLKGGDSFGPQDGELFLLLGRNPVLGALWGWTQDPNFPFIALKSESGAGKTSLLRCGLQHVLLVRYTLLDPPNSAPTPCVYCELQSAEPVKKILADLATAWKEYHLDQGEPGSPALAAKSPSVTTAPESLDDLLAKAHLIPKQLVLILDQFEQMSQDNYEHAPIFEFLVGVCKIPRPSRLTCIIAFRDEYASEWMNFCVRRLDKFGIQRPKEKLLELFTITEAAEVMISLAERADLDIELVQNRLLQVLKNQHSLISPFDLSVSLLCLQQMNRDKMTADAIPENGRDGLLAAYLRSCLKGIDPKTQETVFTILYSKLVNRETSLRVAEGKTLDELLDRNTNRVELSYALNTLAQTDARVLEKLTGLDGQFYFRLRHERYTSALRLMASSMFTEADEILQKMWSAYDPRYPWQRLLIGRDLRLVLEFLPNLALGRMSGDIEAYITKSRRLRLIKRSILALFSVGLWLLYLGIKQESHDLVPLNSSALQSWSTGDFSNAEIKFRKVVFIEKMLLNPQLARHMQDLDSVLMAENKTNEAAIVASQVERIIESDPMNPWNIQARLLKDVGQRVSQRDSKPALLGYWKCRGDAQDSLGHHDGKILGDVTAIHDQNGEALHFDGTNGFVAISNAPMPAVFSVAVRVRFDATCNCTNDNSIQYLVFRKNKLTNGFEAFALNKNKSDGYDRLSFEITSVNTTNRLPSFVRSTTMPILPGQMYYVVGTFDGAWMRLYINGQSQGVESHPFPVDYDSRPMFFGTSGESYYDGLLAGTLEGVALYDGALSPEQVTALYTAYLLGQ